MKVIKLELKNNKKSVFTWVVSLGIIIIILMMFFPSMQTESMKSLTEAKIEGINPFLLESLGISEMVDFSIITNYFGYLLQFVVIGIYIFITQNSFNLFIKEEIEGTIEYLYSKPITRREIYFNKIFYLSFAFTFMILVLSVLSFLSYLIFSDFSLIKSFKEVFLLFSSIYFIGYVYMSLGIFISMFTKSKTGISSIGGGVVMITFILGVLSSLSSKVKWIKFLSPIKWVEYQNVLNNNASIHFIIIITFVVITLLFISLKKYEKRDLLT